MVPEEGPAAFPGMIHARGGSDIREEARSVVPVQDVGSPSVGEVHIQISVAIIVPKRNATSRPLVGRAGRSGDLPEPRHPRVYRPHVVRRILIVRVLDLEGKRIGSHLRRHPPSEGHRGGVPTG